MSGGLQVAIILSCTTWN